MSSTHELLSLLELERRLIAQGAFEALEPLSDRKERLARSLLREEVEGAVLRNLSKISAENGVLLEAAARGIRAALSQVEDARSMAEQSTYDKAGLRQKLSKCGPGLERKV